MQKEYTVNAMITGNGTLKEALHKLRLLRIHPSNIDQLSHLDSKDKSVHIARSSRARDCAYYGFLGGGAIGLLVLLLKQIEMGFPVFYEHPQVVFETLWVHMASGGAVGVFAGYVIGQRLVQYVIRHEKIEGESQFRHLLMVDVNENKKDSVVEALKPVSDSVDVLDNHTEVELGFQSSEPSPSTTT